MDAQWPYPVLPRPTVSTRGTTGAGSVSTEMESGRQRVRKRTANERQEISLTWNFSDLQFKLFKIFWHDVLDSGSQWFTMDMADGDGESQLTEVRVRFIKGEYSYGYQPHMRWNVQASVMKDIVPIEDLSGILFAYTYTSGDPSLLVADFTALNILVHITAPASI